MAHHIAYVHNSWHCKIIPPFFLKSEHWPRMSIYIAMLSTSKLFFHWLVHDNFSQGVVIMGQSQGRTLSWENSTAILIWSGYTWYNQLKSKWPLSAVRGISVAYSNNAISLSVFKSQGWGWTRFHIKKEYIYQNILRIAFASPTIQLY